MREKHAASRSQTEAFPIAKARANKAPITWDGYEPPKPSFTGTRVFEEYDLGELVSRIDWTPFFRTWDLAGRYPQILDDDVVGETATSLFNDAQSMLQRIVGEGWFKPRAVVGFWPANAVGDDIELYADDGRARVLSTIHTLRQQMERKGRDRANFALADFIAPKETGLADYFGGFAVTAGDEVEKRAKAFEAEHDDYSSIMVKALGDRLAEAFAERMHERVRKEFWGYEPDEQLDNEDMISENYRGIRPAPGYPACPDHTEKRILFDLLDAEKNTGLELTSSFAVFPAASVSGFYFSHPDSAYFGVGRIHKDQVEDYARRKGMELREIERWLLPNLAYEPQG